MNYAEDFLTAEEQQSKQTWMRKIQIVLTGKEAYGDTGKVYRMVIGDNTDEYANNDSVSFGELADGYSYNSNGTNLAISVHGEKYVSTLKDNGTVEIMNVDTQTLATIMAMQLYKIEIKCGYGSLGDMFTIASGEVSYITEKPNAYRTNTLYISYASEYVAAWTQQRMTWNINSSVNIYSVLNYMLYQAGGGNNNYYLSDSLKNYTLDKIYLGFETSGSAIENTLNNCQGTYTIDTDSTEGSVISITDINEKRIIRLTASSVSIASGNPTVTSDGLEIDLFPTMLLKVGDILELDTELMGMINLSSGSTTSSGAQSTFNSSYVDANGQYMIREIEYDLENRGNDFIYHIIAKSLSILTNITGVVS